MEKDSKLPKRNPKEKTASTKVKKSVKLTKETQESAEENEVVVDNYNSEDGNPASGNQNSDDNTKQQPKEKKEKYIEGQQDSADDSQKERELDQQAKQTKTLAQVPLLPEVLGSNREKKPRTSGNQGMAQEDEISTPPDSNRQAQGLGLIMSYGLVLIAVVLAVAVGSWMLPEEINPSYPLPSPEADYDYSKVFDNGLKNMETEFTNQTSRFWKILRTRGLSHLRVNKRLQPLVILLGASPSAHNVVDCLATKIATILDPGNDVEKINGINFQNEDGDITKKLLDDALGNNFRKGRRSAVVNHLELLPPPSENLFYSYCDNDNAPYKHVGILFTVHLPMEVDPSLKPVEAEGMVEKFLGDVVWNKKPYDKDAVAALLSRIADTVALVSGEREDVIISNCS